MEQLYQIIIGGKGKTMKVTNCSIELTGKEIKDIIIEAIKEKASIPLGDNASFYFQQGGQLNDYDKYSVSFNS